MIGAEWKKLLRQRWLIGIAILLIFVDVGLFLNTQYTEKKDRVAAVPLFAEYKKETADMTNEQAQEYLTDQLNTLSNFQFVQIAWGSGRRASSRTGGGESKYLGGIPTGWI